ncbi:hypothetical protein FQA47_009855 [Oryzias melastigma]|uniref:Uncharacterized protein n=1 Tax=Oryzias melastigma TaxID=30732 RepID=A0A834C885_ORYME|nr:hypothetical protein FQA47_009855 [Oryzias melastigma]
MSCGGVDYQHPSLSPPVFNERCYVITSLRAGVSSSLLGKQTAAGLQIGCSLLQLRPGIEHRTPVASHVRMYAEQGASALH